MIIGRKGIKNDCCDKESYIIQLINSLRDKVTNCINKINGISPDGDNNFNVLPGSGISIDQENNGIVINSSVDVSQIEQDLTDLYDQVQDIDDYTNTLNNRINNIGLKVGSVNGITPDGEGDLKVVGDDGIVVNSGSDNKLYVGIQGTELTKINKVPTIESNLTTTAGQVETNRQNIVTLQNERKVKFINNTEPNAQGHFNINQGNGITITPGNNGFTISASGGTSGGVQTINNTSPDANGNFTLAAGSNVTLNPTTNGVEIAASGGSASSDWTQWTQGTNWVLNNELFNSSRIAEKDIVVCNSAGTNISNLYVALNEYVPKGSAFDRAIGWNIMLWGNWTDDKVVTSCYVDTSTSTMYTSMQGTTIKCTLKYRTIDANGVVGALTTTTMNITKSNLVVYYK